MTSIGKIYKITCTVTNLSYIGKTIQCVKKRFQQHCDKKSYCRLLLNAIHEHGKDNFRLETIWEGETNKLGTMERKMIEQHDTLSPNGYNLREGGGRSEKVSDESRKLMISKQREISIKKNGKLGTIRENKSKIDGSITSWTFKAPRGGKVCKVALCSTKEDALKIQDEYTNDPDGYEIPESTHKREARGVYYNSKRRKWLVNFNNKYLGRYETEEEANDVLNKYKENPDSYKPVKKENVGITFKKSVNKWSSTFWNKGKLIPLGYYTFKEDAIAARNKFIEDPESFVRPNQRKKIKL